MNTGDPIRGRVEGASLRYGTATIATRIWEHPWDAAAYVDRSPVRADDQSRTKSGGSFHGGWSWEETVTAARDGWPGGAGILGLDAGADAQVRQSTRPAPVWDVEGDAVDVGAFLAGEPECMVSMRRSVRQAPVLRIGVERCIDGGTDEREIRAVGATVASVVEALRLNGVPSEVWSITTLGASSGGDGVQYAIRAQRAGDMVDSDLLAFWLAHPGTLRRIVFAMMEREDGDFRRRYSVGRSGSYGIVPNAADATDPRYAHLDLDTVAPAYRNTADTWAADLLDRHGVGFGRRP
jgi:hypothetical protein